MCYSKTTRRVAAAAAFALGTKTRRCMLRRTAQLRANRVVAAVLNVWDAMEPNLALMSC